MHTYYVRYIFACMCVYIYMCRNTYTCTKTHHHAQAKAELEKAKKNLAKDLKEIDRQYEKYLK
jgi:hypothetical protein